VPVRAWNNARKGTWGLPPPVKLERRDMTYTVSMWRKIQNKQKKYHKKTCPYSILQSGQEYSSFEENIHKTVLIQ
jgi:hypothetical protein